MKTKTEQFEHFRLREYSSWRLPFLMEKIHVNYENILQVKTKRQKTSE